MDIGIIEVDVGPTCEDSVPLTPNQELGLKIVHYLAILFAAINIGVAYLKTDSLKQRIYSPYLLSLGFACLMVAAAFEIASHDYEDNWELAEATKSDLSNGSFSSFNVGAVCILCLALRKVDVPFLRLPSFDKSKGCRGYLFGFLDLIFIIGDFILIITTFATPFLYYYLGRQGSQDLTIPVNSAAGIFTLLRIWQNLGPNTYTLIGGIGYLVLTLCGVFSFAIYKEQCKEIIHFFIGGSFVSSLIPMGVAIYYMDAASPTSIEGDDGAPANEFTPLFRV